MYWCTSKVHISRYSIVIFLFKIQHTYTSVWEENLFSLWYILHNFLARSTINIDDYWNEDAENVYILFVQKQNRKSKTISNTHLVILEKAFDETLIHYMHKPKYPWDFPNQYNILPVGLRQIY